LYLIHHIFSLRVVIIKDEPQESTLKRRNFLLLDTLSRLFVIYFQGNKNRQFSYLRPRHNMASNNTEIHILVDINVSTVAKKSYRTGHVATVLAILEGGRVQYLMCLEENMKTNQLKYY
jgi:hypothetical protein